MVATHTAPTACNEHPAGRRATSPTSPATQRPPASGTWRGQTKKSFAQKMTTVCADRPDAISPAIIDFVHEAHRW